MVLMPHVLMGQEVRKLEDETGKYEGEVKDGKRHGKGTNIGLYGVKYVGDWVDGVAEGYGVYTELNGTKYEGQWKSGAPHGQGKAVYSDGSTYEGSFAGGVRQGQGTFIFPDGLKYVGGFENDRAAGKGVLYFTNGAVYEGDIQKYVPVGNGTSTFPNGDKYVGKWKNGVPEGTGTYTSASGEVADGEWTNGSFTLKRTPGERTEISIALNQGNLVNSSRVIAEVQVAQVEDDPEETENPVQPGGQNQSDAVSPRKKIFSGSVSTTSIRRKLYEDALERGYGFGSIDAYSIQNRYTVPVVAEEMIEFLQEKGYEVGRYVTRKGDGEFHGSYRVLHEMEFFPSGTIAKYAYSLIKNESDPPFNKLKGPGRFFHGYYEVLASPDVLWSGRIVNGLLDGYGVGLVCDGNRFTVFDAEFIMGFPKDKIEGTRWEKNDIKNTKETFGSPKLGVIAKSAVSAEGDFKLALSEYAKATYDSLAAIMEDKYERALVLNDNWPGAIPQTKAIRDGIKQDKQLFQHFVQLYGSTGVDPKSLIPKVKEMIDLYVVLESVTKEFDIMDYLKLGFFHFDWDTDGSDEQREIMRKAQSFCAQNSKDPNLSFRRFYASAREFLIQKQADLEEHIMKSREAYVREMNREQEAMQQYKLDNAELDSKESYPPSGQKIHGYLSSYYSLEKDGRLCLKNGDYLNYNIQYRGDGTVEYYIPKYSDPGIDCPSGRFDTWDAMVKALVTASKNKHR